MCETVHLPGGGSAIVCGGRHRKPRLCHWCGKPMTRLCDFKVGERPHLSAVSVRVPQTCDAPLCDDHATRIAREKDYCPLHAKHSPYAGKPKHPINSQVEELLRQGQKVYSVIPGAEGEVTFSNGYIVTVRQPNGYVGTTDFDNFKPLKLKLVEGAGHWNVVEVRP